MQEITKPETVAIEGVVLGEADTGKQNNVAWITYLQVTASSFTRNFQDFLKIYINKVTKPE